MISEQEILNASILIVDDQAVNIILLEQILSDVGYTTISSTNNPADVCELHRANHYDLILLDLQMPVMDGFQVLEALKKIESDDYLPVLVITAQPAHKLQALRSGAKDFISKPFELAEVQTRIHNMLEVRMLYKSLENINRGLEQMVWDRTVKLLESEARFRRLTELSSDWYWEQDESGHFNRIFGPVMEMLGIRIDDALGQIRDDHGAHWNEAERDMLEANLKSRKPFLDFIYSRTKANGSRQYLMVSGEPMFDQTGRFKGYRGIGKDVTESINLKPPYVSAQSKA
jgi:PAS domain S-box-containing protein